MDNPAAGLVETIDPRTGRTVWVEPSPERCPAGHTTLQARWLKCMTCGYACRHWTCSTDGCAGEIRAPWHVCDGEREVDPHRR
jgi:hypothetical protein